MGLDPVRARPLAPLLLALVAIATTAAAQVERSARSKASGIEARATYLWPERVHQGYLPIQVELFNDGDETHSLSIDCTRQYETGTGVDGGTVRLEPGQRTRLELVAPAWENDGSWFSQATYDLRIRGAGDVLLLRDLGEQDSGDPDRLALMVFSRGSGSQLAVALEGALGAADPFDFAPSLSWGGEVDLAWTDFENLPRRYEAYTSLDAAVIDTSRGWPEPARLEPLVAYARTGGTLAFFGPDADELARGFEPAGRWMEERFERSRWGAVRLYSCGLGRLVVGPGEAGEIAPDQLEALLAAQEDWASRLPSPRGLQLAAPAIPGLGELPYRAFAVLLLIFAFVIGPVNFVAVKRTGRPVLLLVTIPAIALVTSLGFTIFGALHQGIDIKSASVSHTVLDQRSGHASTHETRQIFVGLTPGAGLRPLPGTSVYPHLDDPSESRAKRFRIAEGPERRLTGEFLPARRAVNQVLLCDRPAHLRLGLEPRAGALHVENGLDTPLTGLYVRGPSGQWYASEGPLERGQGAKLLTVELDEVPLVSVRLDPPRGPIFVALADRNPFTDACGLELNETSGRHIVLGILDEIDPGAAGGAAW